MLNKLLNSLGKFIESNDAATIYKLAELLQSNPSTSLNSVTINLIKQIAKDRGITEFAVLEEALDLTNIELSKYSEYRKALIK